MRNRAFAEHVRSSVQETPACQAYLHIATVAYAFSGKNHIIPGQTYHAGVGNSSKVRSHNTTTADMN
jgi:hypothetical protein